MSERVETASLARGLALRPTDVLIAVMGVTGAGKSTFISLCSEQHVQIGHTLQACTTKVDVYSFAYNPTTTVFLIDTPGFDDTNRNDTEVLREIAGWLTESYSNKVKLNGILYLHRISDVRMPGSAKKNLMMFKKLCGQDALKNVILATTMWDKVTPTQGDERESQLTSTPDFWGWMVSKGSVVRRHAGDRQSAIQLLEHFIEHRSPVVLGIQREMVEEQKNLNETSAGMTVQDELIKEREKYQKELSEVERSMKEAIKERDHEAAQAMRELRDDYRREMERLNLDRQKLKTDMENLHAQKSAELLKKLEEQQKAHAEEIKRNELKWTQENAMLKQQLAMLTEMKGLKISPTTSNQPFSSSTPPASTPPASLPPVPSDAPSNKVTIYVNKKWLLGQPIKKGSVYKATNQSTQDEVAIKLEHRDVRPSHLDHEARIYTLLAGNVGISTVHWSGVQDDYRALVLDLLGPTLEDLLDFCKGKFSLKTVLLLADQFMNRIEATHAKSLIHRNIKPENLTMGIRKRGSMVYLIDFARAKAFRDLKTHVHIPYTEVKRSVWNAYYASVNSHLSVEPSRRDDMESIGYILIHFLNGCLPWSDVKVFRGKKIEDIIMEKKAVPAEILCRGLPNEFKDYLNYTRAMNFTDKPDYAYCRKLFRDLFIREGFAYDYAYDWITIGKKKG